MQGKIAGVKSHERNVVWVKSENVYIIMFRVSIVTKIQMGEGWRSGHDRRIQAEVALAVSGVLVILGLLAGLPVSSHVFARLSRLSFTCFITSTVLRLS